MKKFHITINWPDHIVGFFSALFGILIAFQLEEWRDQNERKQLVALALQNLKNEIDINKNYYHEATRFNNAFLNFLNDAKWLTEDVHYRGTGLMADSLNKLFPDHFQIDTLLFDRNSDVEKQSDLRIVLNISLHHPITAAWESAKATGALNYMDFEKVHLLSLIYHQEKLLNEIDHYNDIIETSSRITTRTQLYHLIADLKESNLVLKRELEQMNGYINILLATD